MQCAIDTVLLVAAFSIAAGQNSLCAAATTSSRATVAMIRAAFLAAREQV